MRRLLFAAVLALAAAGCKSQCRQLSEKLCDCSASALDKEACLRRASSEESRLPPSDEDEARCQALAEGCDCHLVHTAEGKRACGLSR